MNMYFARSIFDTVSMLIQGVTSLKNNLDLVTKFILHKNISKKNFYGFSFQLFLFFIFLFKIYDF